MSQVDNLNLFFVLPTESSSEKDAGPTMKTAFDLVLKYGNNGEFVKPSFCNSHEGCKNDVFIFEKFEGPAFKKLKQNSSKIIGARCLLTCISDGRSLPPGPAPVLTDGMRDLIVCCTGFDSKTKNYIQEKVEHMGGLFAKDLRSATTHMVTHNNLSVKAYTAASLGIPLMKLEWIETVFNKSMSQHVNGKDSMFNEYQSPLFHNIRITTSGIAKLEKENLKSLIKKYGGTWTGEMEEHRTNIVVLNKAQGDKFKFAQNWNIPCVKPEWIYSCDERGIILDIKEYLLKPGNRASTPKKDEANLTANFSVQCSRIECETDRTALTHIDETNQSVASRVDFQPPRPVSLSVDIVSEISLEDVKRAGQFLDGFNIFMCGFKSQQIDKLKKVLNLGGATRFVEFSNSVTHIIAGRIDSEVEDLKDKGAVIVKIDWLIQSIIAGKPVPEEPYYWFDVQPNAIESASPSSKQAAELLVTNKSVSKLCLDQPEPDPAEDELLKNYHQESADEAFKQLEKLADKSQREDETRRNKTLTSFNTSSVSSTTSADQSKALFHRLKFYLSEELADLDRQNISEVIIENSGQVVNKRYPGVPDYAVVPIHGASLSDITTREVVNLFFIVDCCLANSIVPMQYYHQPVAFVNNSQPLSGCVISVSNYVQTERDFVEQLITSLGACFQASLARKPKDGVLKSTHLVCAEGTGPKYEGALRWGLPVVYHDWLLKCASLGIKVSEQPYLVTSNNSRTKEPATPNSNVSMSTTQKNPPSSVKQTEVVLVDKVTAEQNNTLTPTPLNITPQVKNSFEFHNSFHTPMNRADEVTKTPLVNNVIKRLRQEDTPVNSPGANRTLTPTSPYGAFYGNDNPSPGTRKRLLRWMNQGIEFPQDPPMKKWETPEKTTPISELLSRQLAIMKRKPEDAPPDDSPFDSPCSHKRRNIEEVPEFSQTHVISAALERMKKIEEDYIKTNPKPQTPVRKSNEFVAPQQHNMLVIAESQPHTEVGWDDPTDKEIALQKLQQTAESQIQLKVFMLSGFNDSSEAKALIEECGGKLSTINGYDKNATHLITGSLTRAEKIMCSISAGIWVLHSSYLDELRQVKSVYAVSEEEYEWGNPNRTARLESLPINARECAESAYYWRNELRGNRPAVFQGLKVILHVPEHNHRYEAFKRMIEAGSGSVVKAIPPYDDPLDANLCIVDPSVKDKINFEYLARRGINCVVQFYISDKVLRKCNPPEHYFVPEFAKIKNS